MTKHLHAEGVNKVIKQRQPPEGIWLLTCHVWLE